MPKQRKAKSKVESKSKELFWGRELEYIMPRQTFNDLTKDCKGDKYQFAMDYINQTYGLLGHVTSLVLEGEE
jgi:hypothetical protein